MDLFSWERFFENIPRLIKYLPVTFELVLVSELIGIILAVGIALARINKVHVLSQFCAVYVSFMRGTPMLVQMLLVYYGLPMLLNAVFGMDVNAISKIVFVIITYALNQGAFIGEIFRSSILSVDSGQTEAAYSVGMTRLQTFKRIIAPQAARIALPAFGSDFIVLFHNTSLAFMVGVIDMLGRARALQATTKHVLESYVFIMIVFVIISLLLKAVFGALDKRTLDKW
jgi:L-cystine transport system permease protein